MSRATMAVHPQAATAPPVEVVISEAFATLAFAAHAYMASSEPEKAAEDLAAAEIAIDLAGKAFDRIAPRLSPDERSAMAALLTDLRMTFVRKRGL